MSRTSWVLLISFLLSGDSLSSIDRAFISLAFMFTHSSTHGTRCDQAKRMRLMDVHLYICADLWSVISDNGWIITIRIRRAIAICDKIIKDFWDNFHGIQLDSEGRGAVVAGSQLLSWLHAIMVWLWLATCIFNGHVSRRDLQPQTHGRLFLMLLIVPRLHSSRYVA